MPEWRRGPVFGVSGAVIGSFLRFFGVGGRPSPHRSCRSTACAGCSRSLHRCPQRFLSPWRQERPTYDAVSPGRAPQHGPTRVRLGHARSSGDQPCRCGRPVHPHARDQLGLGHIDWSVAGLLALGALPASVASVWFAEKVMGATLRQMFGWFLVLSGVAFVVYRVLGI